MARKTDLSIVSELDPNKSSNFALLSNNYVVHSHFEEATIEQGLFLKEKQMDRSWM
jgi:hypothetical protein